MVLTELKIILIYFFYKIQVILLTNVEIFTKYSNFSNVFFLNYAIELLKHTKIHNYLIHLQNDKQLLYRLIHSLKLVDLEIIKIYIKANLIRSFIRPSKSSVNDLIFFV